MMAPGYISPDVYIKRAYRSYRLQVKQSIPRVFTLSFGDELVDMRAILKEWQIGKDGTNWGHHPVKCNGRALSMPDMQRMTWTLACESLHMLPIPRVLYTMTLDNGDANEAFLKIGSATRQTLRSLYSAAVFGLDVELCQVAYAKSAKEVEALWDQKARKFNYDLDMYLRERAPLRQKLEAIYQEQGDADGGFIGGTIGTMAGGFGAAALTLASGGVLLPFFALGLGIGSVGMTAGFASNIVASKKQRNQIEAEIAMINAKLKPTQLTRYSYNKQVRKNSEHHDRITQNILFVTIKTGIHAFLAVLEAQLSSVDSQLQNRRKTSYYKNKGLPQKTTMSLDAYKTVIRKAVGEDRKDSRLTKMFATLDDSFKPALKVASPLQLSYYATGLCKLLLFKLMP